MIERGGFFGHGRLTDDQRERAKSAACFAGERVPNGPAAHTLKEAGRGLNEDMLLGVYLIMHPEEWSDE